MMYNSRDEVERIGRAGSCLRYFGNSIDTPAYRYLSNFWLFVEPRDKAFTPHGPDGFWESWITTWLSRQLEDANLFIDVGANVGYYSLMAGRAGIKTVAIEPQGRLCAMIRASTDVNRLNHNVTVVNKAASNKSGSIFLAVPDEHSGGAYISEDITTMPELNWHSEEVHTDRLDRMVSIVPDSKVIVKIDAEGAEPKIWAGMQGIFAVTDCTVILEWDRTRYDAEHFAQALFDGNQNYIAYVDFSGDEQELIHWSQLAELQELQMVVVRKNG